ncbi:hypothetical protein OVA21_03920 [Dietzia sp. SL131]|uniref:hypothetical protein n=1 Tax=Dietzia sp. SL131 TaxID=2995149 RepID=UPI00227C7059|nr:hypothetical protein [Dietzia sp. SL131]MCY1656368.1 hypothetical protein [Dietzia sp. SL131]
MAMDKFSDKPIDIDAMLAKREEVVGSADRFPFIALGETWWCIDPRLADDSLQYDLEDLRDDLDDGEIDSSEFRTALIDLYLGDEQGEKFRATGGQMKHINAALEAYADTQADPTRRSSRATRRRANRR